MDYTTEKEKLLNENLDAIRKNLDEMKGLYSLATFLREINLEGLSSMGRAEFKKILINEINRYAIMASNTWFLTEEREPEAMMDLED